MHRLSSWKSRWVSGNSGTAAANILLTGLSALVGLGLARSLGPSDRGIYAAAIAWVGIATFLGELGTSSGIVYFSAGDPVSRSRVMQSARRIYFLLGIGTAIICIALIPLLAANDAVYRLTLLSFFLFLPVTFQAGIPVFALQATDIPRWNAARLSQPVLFAALLLACAAVVPLTLENSIACLFASTAIQLTYAYWLLRRPTQVSDPTVLPGLDEYSDGSFLPIDPAKDTHEWVPEPKDPPRDFVRPLLAYGTRTLAATAPSALSRLDILVLSLAVSPTILGEYAVALTFASLAGPVATSFGYVAFPALARLRNGEQAAETAKTTATTVKRALLGAAATAIAAGFIIAIVAPTAAPLLLGDTYPITGLLTSALCFAATARAISAVCGDMLRGLGRPGAPGGPEWLGALVLVICMLAFVQPFGVWGAVLGNSVAAAVTLVAYLVVIRRSLRALVPAPGGLS